MTAIQLRTELFREMSPLLDNEPAMEKMLTFIRILKPTKTAKSEVGWADRFAGAWKDDRTADEIISDIRSARTVNHIEDLCLIDITAQMVSYGNFRARENFLKFAATLPPTGLKALVYGENRVAADGWQGGSKMGKSGLSQSKIIEKRV